MEKELRVSCPCCGAILIIDRISGRILETREPLVEQSTGDRLGDAFLKQTQDRDKRDALFDNIKENQDKKRKLSEELFKASLEDAKKDKDVKPRSIFDVE